MITFLLLVILFVITIVIAAYAFSLQVDIASLNKKIKAMEDSYAEYDRKNKKYVDGLLTEIELLKRMVYAKQNNPPSKLQKNEQKKTKH